MNEILLQVVDALIDGLGNLIGWILVGLVALIFDTYRRIRKNAEDINDLERYVTGDDDDPGAPGLLETVDEVGDEVHDVKYEMREQHRQTDRKLDRLLNGDGGTETDDDRD